MGELSRVSTAGKEWSSKEYGLGRVPTGSKSFMLIGGDPQANMYVLYTVSSAKVTGGGAPLVIDGGGSSKGVAGACALVEAGRLYRPVG